MDVIKARMREKQAKHTGMGVCFKGPLGDSVYGRRKDPARTAHFAAPTFRGAICGKLFELRKLEINRLWQMPFSPGCQRDIV